MSYLKINQKTQPNTNPLTNAKLKQPKLFPLKSQKQVPLVKNGQ